MGSRDELMFERMAAVQAFQRRREELVREKHFTRNALREEVQRDAADQLDRTRFTRPSPPVDAAVQGMAIRDRTKMPFMPDYWRRRKAGYGAMNR